MLCPHDCTCDSHHVQFTLRQNEHGVLEQQACVLHTGPLPAVELGEPSALAPDYEGITVRTCLWR